VKPARFRRYIFSLTAVATAAALTVSTVPASASALPARTAAVAQQAAAAQHAAVAQHASWPVPRVRPIYRGAPDQSGYITNICLSNANTTCFGVDPWNAIGVIMQSVINAGSLVMIYCFFFPDQCSGVSGGNNGEFQSDGDDGGGVVHSTGECLAAQGDNRSLTYESCSIAHGDYWELQAVSDTDFYIWNTAYHCFVDTGSASTGSKTDVPYCTPKRAGWSTWSLLEP
jgi:hypothetical protein